MFKVKKLLVVLIAATILLSGLGLTASPAQASGCWTYHTIRWGETLSSIGRYYGVSWPYLAQINGIRWPYRIYAGTRLCIAGGGYYQTPYYPPYNQPYYPPYNQQYYPQYQYYNNQYYNPYYSQDVTSWSFTVIGVVQNSSVTIRSYNFPTNVWLNVRMGYRQTNGAIYWAQLPDLDTGYGWTTDYIFGIPTQFANISPLVLNLAQYKKNGKVFAAEQWFNNTTSGATAVQPIMPAAVAPAAVAPAAVAPVAVEPVAVAPVPAAPAAVAPPPVAPVAAAPETVAPMAVAPVAAAPVAAAPVAAAPVVAAPVVAAPAVSYPAVSSQVYGYSYPGNAYYNNYTSYPDSAYYNYPSYPGYTSPTYCPGCNYYYGIPTIWIASVVRDSSVRFTTHNFPPNLVFDVLMGPMGSQGIGGYYVMSFNSGAGGSFSVDAPIPPALYGSYQIAIRTQNLGTGFYSYNWFYNNTTY